MAHIVFYDGSCALCNRAVRFLQQADRKRTFHYQPLQGEVAEQLLTHPISLDSMILLENPGAPNQKELREGKAVLRICWHLGRWWRLLGWLSFLPNPIANFIYRLIARNRHLF